MRISSITVELLCIGSGARSRVYGSPDPLTSDDPGDRAVGVEAEEDHRKPGVPGPADRGGVGHPEVPGQVLAVAEAVELLGAGAAPRAGVVDAVGGLRTRH